MTEMRAPTDKDPPDPWTTSMEALALLAIDPAGLGGIRLVARASPLTQDWCRLLPDLLPARPFHRLAPGASDQTLYGGIDLAGTMAAGKRIETKGVLRGEPALFVLPMAERASPGFAARLAAALDDDSGHALVALDEGAEPEEGLTDVLGDRLAFHLDFSGVRHVDCRARPPDQASIEAARGRLHAVDIDDAALDALVVTAFRMLVPGLRAPVLAARCARASAALHGRDRVSQEDVLTAARLVLAPRMRALPEPAETEDTTPPPEKPDEQTDDRRPDSQETDPRDVLVEAIAASLPPHLLEQLRMARAASASQQNSGRGGTRKTGSKGRPLPPRQGRPSTQSRIDVLETLKAAAPWQKIRRVGESVASPQRILFRPSDLRVKRHKDREQRLVIFAVDASGSMAVARLAEAKGAVELLLAEAYASRDQVALIAFRGEGADILLPPTKSLVRTKRELSALPGGGGTPLAAGLNSALGLALSVRSKGLSPSLALLTDGRANITLEGTPGRSQAQEDAFDLARVVRANRVPALVIDTANRPQKQAGSLAEALGGPYLPLPRANAQILSQAVSALRTT